MKPSNIQKGNMRQHETEPPAPVEGKAEADTFRSYGKFP